MNEIFKIENLNVKIDDKLLLSNFSCELKSSVCVLGESGSGKTLLLQEIFSSLPLEYVSKTEFFFSKEEKVVNWKEYLDYGSLSADFQLFLDTFFRNRQYISLKCGLMKAILKRPTYFFLDDISLERDDFQSFVSFLKKLNIKLFFVTSDIEKVVWFDYLFVLKNNQVAIEGETFLVLKEEKLMKLLGFSLPFYVNLSKQLGYYGLLNEIYYNKEDMEVALWQSK